MTQTVVSIDPFRCRLWPLHERLHEWINAESCTAEIQSFKKHGQMIPVLGRPLHADPECEIELIYGARRMFVSRFLKVPLIVEVRELSDREAVIAMDVENRQRVDLSPYEQGLSYARWLRSGHFGSQEEMAKALSVSTAHISRLLKMAGLPSIVVSAFGNGGQIRETWGLELMEALSDPDRRRLLLRAARSICNTEPRPMPSQVRGRLLAAGLGGCGHLPRKTSGAVVLRNSLGSPSFRAIRQLHSMTYLLPRERTSPQALREIEQAVTRILISRRNEKVLSARRPRSPVRIRSLPDART